MREAGDRDRTENIHKHERVRKVFFHLAIEILSSDLLCDNVTGLISPAATGCDRRAEQINQQHPRINQVGGYWYTPERAMGRMARRSQRRAT
jgi:hypothetical protein